LRELDGSRPVTYAANHRKEDLCLGLVDIVSWNLYTGWYGDAPEMAGGVFEDLLAWLDSADSHGGKGKPVILSEFGGGAIPGVRSPQKDLWSEDYQEVVLDETLKAYLSHPRIVGAAIWQFCDVRVSRENNPHPHNSYGPMGRPRTMNNKGVVDEYRRPKLAYGVVKKRMGKAVKRRGTV
jgi:beta-glucuronidase